VIALELADLIVIASRTLGLNTDQVLGLLDPAAAESALAQARPAGDPAADAAALLHALVRQRPLRRGNQQVALAAMLQFLALNGQDMDPGVPLLVAVMVTELEAGTLSTRDVADWLAPRLRPGFRAAARTKEAPVPEGMFERFTDRAWRIPRTRMVRLPVPASLADTLEQFPRVRRQKAAAVEAGDFEGAAALRDTEQRLRAEILRLAREWGAGAEVPAIIAEEDPQVRRELDRLRNVARQHGIDPDGGTARTA
jgi:prophage maintenance system killer protein